MKITVELTGDQAVRRAFASLDEVVRRQALRETAQHAFDYVQDEADRHTKTGALARSLVMQKVGDNWDVVHRLQIAPHALFVHWGTKPHAIKPKKRKALRFYTKGGKEVFSRGVWHPGYRGDPWFERAARDAPRVFAEAVNRRLREMDRGR